ncbi:MAG: SCP2 sterol-binding domain-containing protein [Pseudorhodobacter sp.]|nr:SCP2 sterol-binding domain-containing protein [Pseudorhodobacter sp.]
MSKMPSTSKMIDAAVAALSRKVPSFDGVAKFVITGEGAIMIDQAGVRAGDEDADVTLTASAEVFQAILAGEMNPTSAFMTGKLSVEGAMGLAMQLGAVLG